MFGNVIPLKCALTKEDMEIFNSYYCGLCREIGKRNQTARLGLSYDMTFLAILIDSLSSKEIEFEPGKRCILHPLKKLEMPCQSRGLLYAADVSVLLIKAKLDDDARDDGNLIKRLLSVIISEKKLFDKESVKEVISTQLKKLDSIEKDDVRDADISSDCFAVLCGELFKLAFEDEKVKNIIGWLGYNLGRWIYLLDAWEDLESDIKKGSYNPYKGLGITKEENEEQLYYTLSQVGAAFDLLPVMRYHTLLENIIYLGLAARQRAVFHPEERKKKNESVRSAGRKSE